MANENRALIPYNPMAFSLREQILIANADDHSAAYCMINEAMQQAAIRCFMIPAAILSGPSNYSSSRIAGQ